MIDPESDLFDQAVAGDVSAVRILLERHGPQVYTRIDARIGRQWRAMIDADDVMQVALLPVAYTKGTDFKRAERPPVADITHWNTW